MARNLRVEVDKDLCASTGSCIGIAPGVFRFDADGQAELYDVTGAPEADIIDACASCPTGALAVFDADTGEDLLD